MCVVLGQTDRAVLSHCTIMSPPPPVGAPLRARCLFSRPARGLPRLLLLGGFAAPPPPPPPPLSSPRRRRSPLPLPLCYAFLFGGRSATPSSLSPSPSLSLPYLSHPHRHRHKHDAVCSVVRSQRRVDDSAAVAPKQYGSNLERKNFARGACIHVLAYTTKGTTYMTCTRTHAHARSVEAVCRVALLVCS